MRDFGTVEVNVFTINEGGPGIVEVNVFTINERLYLWETLALWR